MSLHDIGLGELQAAIGEFVEAKVPCADHLAKLRQELVELEAHPDDPEEVVDVILAALAHASAKNMALSGPLLAKLAAIQNREYQIDPDTHIAQHKEKVLSPYEYRHKTLAKIAWEFHVPDMDFTDVATIAIYHHADSTYKAEAKKAFTRFKKSAAGQQLLGPRDTLDDARVNFNDLYVLLTLKEAMDVLPGEWEFGIDSYGAYCFQDPAGRTHCEGDMALSLPFYATLELLRDRLADLPAEAVEYAQAAQSARSMRP